MLFSRNIALIARVPTDLRTSEHRTVICIVDQENIVFMWYGSIGRGSMFDSDMNDVHHLFFRYNVSIGSIHIQKCKIRGRFSTQERSY